MLLCFGGRSKVLKMDQQDPGAVFLVEIQESPKRQGFVGRGLKMLNYFGYLIANIAFSFTHILDFMP